MKTLQLDLMILLIAGTPIVGATTLAAQPPEPSEPSTVVELTREEKEQFLLHAEIIEKEDLEVGVTGSQRATLSDGTLIHDAHIQDVDILKRRFQNDSWSENNFKDSYKFNIAAYRLDKLLDLNMVPVTVSRKVGFRFSAVAWWVDDVKMTGVEIRDEKPRMLDEESWIDQQFQGWVFQNLIYNIDPNYGNFLMDEQEKLWLLDFTRAFRLRKAILDDTNLKRIGRGFYRKLRELDAEEVQRELGPVLTKMEIKSLMARRDLLVQYFEKLIEERSEAAVIIDRPGF